MRCTAVRALMSVRVSVTVREAAATANKLLTEASVVINSLTLMVSV